MIIYKVQNRINEKVFIGSTTRWNDLDEIKKEHYKQISTKTSNYFNIYLHNSMRTHGKSNFQWDVLHNNFGSIEALNATEIFCIEYFKAYYNGFNLTTGGTRVQKIYPKLRITAKKDNGWTGRKHTEKSKQKMSLIKSKLSYADVTAIVDLAGTKTLSQKKIGVIYGLGQSTISDLLCKKTYKHFI